MEVMLWIVNHLSGIIFFAWTVLLAMNMYSNHKNKKSNKELLDKIYQTNALNNQLLKTVKKYCDSTERRSTAQDNLMWESILILARRIHNLEDNNYVE